jgi:Flp pilus assembly protein protease CpaA
VTTTTTTTTTITAFGYISVDFWILVAVLAILLAVVIMLSRRTSRKIAIEPMDTRVR